jgi:ABC-type polar amino acid transport system ATPase subunit
MSLWHPISIKKIKKEKANKMAMDLLGKVGLADKASNYPNTLSGDSSKELL